MSGWLLSPAGNALHRPRPAPRDVPVAVCDGMLTLSRRRTARHTDLIQADRHPRCQRCERSTR